MCCFSFTRSSWYKATMAVSAAKNWGRWMKLGSKGKAAEIFQGQDLFALGDNFLLQRNALIFPQISRSDYETPPLKILLQIWMNCKSNLGEKSGRIDPSPVHPLWHCHLKATIGLLKPYCQMLFAVNGIWWKTVSYVSLFIMSSTRSSSSVPRNDWHRTLQTMCTWFLCTLKNH